jgi:Methylamine utilisation protein MauE
MTGDSTAPPSWKRVLGNLGGVFLGAVLLIAAWAKALDPAAFADQIHAEGLDFLLPAGVVALIGVALEVGLGSALVLCIRRRWVLAPAAGLVVFFLFLTGRTYWRALHGIETEAGCGCFGNLVQRTPAEAFWQDALLMVPALLLAFLAARFSAGVPRVRTAVAAALTVAAVVFAWKAPELPLDDFATRLKPGVDALSWCAGSGGDSPRVCMDGILPELAVGEHVVVLADVTDEAFAAEVERLNEYQWNGNGPALWVAVGNTEEELFGFRFGHGPAFEIREAPPALLKPLYRTLPRSFLVQDGVVVATYRGLPPLEELAATAAGAAESGSTGRS